MRYITARQNHVCVVCKEVILKGEICIQSQGGGRYGLMYHEDCHRERFDDSWIHAPTNVKPKMTEESIKKVLREKIREKKFRQRMANNLRFNKTGR